MWQCPPYAYGNSMPYVQNTMQHDAYEFLRQYIHFADNYQWPRKQSNKNQDWLFKVTYILKEIISGICRVWQARKDISLDEYMIKYCGGAVMLLPSSNICQHQSQSNTK